ncbi:hypothetical protein G7Y31_09700 [Corynebacterium lizhenjunii]|uniref:Uncharacterized protein n=1 Tax=Corynebacterium lizhenjunii TaxID=2709394 RepID=A0A7T0KDJ2_9CORY|nr:hypothetical protein [Corynebacterium lizhenjunii]QPK78801.1 hypothetical protein G7Y31_09700 [Corynebacterium lizhenjunii]
MAEPTLTITSGGAGLRALLSRAAGLDTHATLRARQLTDSVVDVFVTTPFDVIASRRVAGRLSQEGVSASAARVAQALADAHSGTAAESADAPCLIPLGPAQDAAWPGALPPAAGFRLLDTLPVTVVRQLADEGQALTRQFSGPAGPPASLLSQTVVTVSSGGADDQSGGGGQASVDIPMRLIFACTNLGLIPGWGAADNVPRYLRVSAAGRWVRVDAPFGTVYHSKRSLLLSPL